MAVHAVRSERVLLPTDGRGPGGFLGDAGISEDAGRKRRPQSHGHRRSARPTISCAEALDGLEIPGSKGSARALEHAHLRFAQDLATWIDEHPDFERMAPVPFSVVCFRWRPADRNVPQAELNMANERLLDAVNASGEVFLSHTRLDGCFVPRLAIGHIDTTERHVQRAWQLLQENAARIVAAEARGTHPRQT